MNRFLGILMLGFCLTLSGCLGAVFTPTGVRVFRYHVAADVKDLETLVVRLYAKNPKYQSDLVWQQKRIAQIFHDRPILGACGCQSSDEVLDAAFSPHSSEPDRVYLLGLGLVKSIKEAYGTADGMLLFTALQVPLARLKRLEKNLSQVNWRLKTYKDEQGELLFRTNEMGDDGYLNMGYEVIMNSILTRVQDDIYMRGGLPGKYIFDMSTLFVSIVL